MEVDRCDVVLGPDFMINNGKRYVRNAVPRGRGTKINFSRAPRSWAHKGTNNRAQNKPAGQSINNLCPEDLGTRGHSVWGEVCPFFRTPKGCGKGTHPTPVPEPSEKSILNPNHPYPRVAQWSAPTHPRHPNEGRTTA